MKTWIEPQIVEVPPALTAEVGGHPLVAETLVRRGLKDAQQARAFLDPEAYYPAPPADLPDMDAAVERVSRAVRRGEMIGVWGDFDVDGQTATTLLVSALRALGGQVVYHIPNRQAEGHGVNISGLARMIESGVDVVLTCDTGIAAHEAVDYARARMVDVVITDHHNLPPNLPDACAVVNPKRLPEAHPLRDLPGVGVAYKLVEALFVQAGREEETEGFLDLVALGIVADVAVQRDDTRYLLQRGLAVLRRAERLGLRALMESADLDAGQVSEEHIGFVLGPRLNALGRLDDANMIVEFLTTHGLAQARIMATQLEGLNTRRKLLTDQVYEGALAQIARDPSLLDYSALVLANPHWHTGVIGIAASRLADRYNRPVILLASPEGEIARGSARSVDGCDISAAIGLHQDMLVGFGGHTMAAGLSLEPERIPEFRRALSRTVRQVLGEVDTTPTLRIDAYVKLSELTLELVEALERLTPFGPGNPPLTLASQGMILQSHRVIGRTAEHRQLVVEDESGASQRVLWWQGADEPLPQGRFDLAYVVRASDYQGRREVQVEWQDARLLDSAELRGRTLSTEVVDYRQEYNPVARLKHLQTQLDSLMVWAEGLEMSNVEGQTRMEMEPADALVIWTSPPGPLELRAVLDRVLPRRVFLFAVDPGINTLETFIKRLSGLIRYALSTKGGEVRLADLAAATAQREITVRTGIEWLVARGAVRVKADAGDIVHLMAGAQTNGADPNPPSVQLNALLAETSAYRAYYKRADHTTLI